MSPSRNSQDQAFLCQLGIALWIRKEGQRGRNTGTQRKGSSMDMRSLVGNFSSSLANSRPCCFRKHSLNLSGLHHALSDSCQPVLSLHSFSKANTSFLLQGLTPIPRPASKFRCGLTVLFHLSNAGLLWTFALCEARGVLKKGVIPLGLTPGSCRARLHL